MTLGTFRAEWPVLKTAFLVTQELYEATNPGSASDLGIGPTFDELLEVVRQYRQRRVQALGEADPRDVGIYYWRQQVLDVLENAILPQSKCPYCGTASRGAVKCPNCDAPLDPSADATPSAGAGGGSGFCTNCGTSYDSDDRFCGKCGQQVG